MKMRTVLCSVITLVMLGAHATPYVTNVVAKQRYPWNGKVDITYETYGFGEAGTENVFTKITARDLDVGYTYVATNLIGAIEYSDGRHHVVWDMEQYGQLPDKRFEFSVIIKPCPKYCVIDVSGGSSAASYPVSYLDSIPAGGWSDTYKTEKIVLRRVDPGHRLCVPMAYTYEQYQSYISQGKFYWDIWLTNPYYMGVFEVTQRQYELVMGESPKGGGGSGDTKPQEYVTYVAIRGTPSAYCWLNDSVDGDSFMGKLREKTGIHFDLPTNWQWENACTAGVETDFNNGGSAESDMQQVGCYIGNSGIKPPGGDHAEPQLKCVGCYTPNNLGLYDMHGNVREWTVNADRNPVDEFNLFSDDNMVCYPYGMSVFDPKGRYDWEISSAMSSRHLRGGSYLDSWNNCGSRWQDYKDISTSADGNGFRLCWTVK